jgi:hypothetical protein
VFKPVRNNSRRDKAPEETTCIPVVQPHVENSMSAHDASMTPSRNHDRDLIYHSTNSHHEVTSSEKFTTKAYHISLQYWIYTSLDDIHLIPYWLKGMNHGQVAFLFILSRVSPRYLMHVVVKLKRHMKNPKRHACY